MQDFCKISEYDQRYICNNNVHDDDIKDGRNDDKRQKRVESRQHNRTISDNFQANEVLSYLQHLSIIFRSARYLSQILESIGHTYHAKYNITY